jgi:hypothetical protein
MQTLNQITLIRIVHVLAVLLGVGIVVLLTPSSRSSRDALRTGITEQSRHYVETLGSKPFEMLTVVVKSSIKRCSRLVRSRCWG